MTSLPGRGGYTKKNDAIETWLELVSDRQAIMFLQRKQMVCLRTSGAKSDDFRKNYVRVHGNDSEANFGGASRAKESLLIDSRTSPAGLNCVLTDVCLQHCSSMLHAVVIYYRLSCVFLAPVSSDYWSLFT